MKSTPQMIEERIVCSAVRESETDLLICGVRHYDKIMNDVIRRLASYNTSFRWEQGFVTNKGRFVFRDEALKIAKKNNQILRECGNPDSDELFSENLY